jgi:CHAT domain-containing protein
MNAGANSVLMSLWNIDSYSAKVFNESLFEKSIFTNSFYLSDSIQDSMIDMINSEQYSHPYYWAPYIYLGR